MNFAQKQRWFLITTFLLQAAIVFASPDEANTSAAKQKFTLGELIQKLARNQTWPPSFNNVSGLVRQNRPIDENIAASLRDVLPNYSWLIAPTPISEYVKEPQGVQESVFTRIRNYYVRGTRVDGDQYVLLVNPDNGDWLWGLLFNVELVSEFQRERAKLSKGLTRLNQNIYFLPISYYCQQSQDGPEIYKVRRAHSDGLKRETEPIATRWAQAEYSEQECRAKSIVSRETEIKPFGLVLKYYPKYVQARYFNEPDDSAFLNTDYESSSPDDDMRGQRKWYSGAFSTIKKVLKHGGALVLTQTQEKRLIPIGPNEGDIIDLDYPSYSYPGCITSSSQCVVMVTGGDRPARYYEFNRYEGYLSEQQKRQ